MFMNVGAHASLIATSICADLRASWTVRISCSLNAITQCMFLRVSAAIYTSGGTARSTISFNASAALTQFEADTPSNASMVYDQDGDRFLFWDGVTGRLFQITPNGTTTWDVSIVTTTGTTPPATEYSFGRLGYIPSLKTIVTMPSGATNLRAMRLA